MISPGKIISFKETPVGLYDMSVTNKIVLSHVYQQLRFYNLEWLIYTL